MRIVHTTLRVPCELYEELARDAELNERSINGTVIVALRKYITEKNNEK